MSVKSHEVVTGYPSRWVFFSRHFTILPEQTCLQLLTMEQPKLLLTGRLADKLLYHPEKSYSTLNLSNDTLQRVSV